jgi:hypothetical protein
MEREDDKWVERELNGQVVHICNFDGSTLR